MNKRKFDVGECSHNTIEPRSNEGVGDVPLLEPKHKIFLSHSGVQKEFVDYLCKALEDCCRYPFFDRRPKCLPKGKEFADLIVKAAEQCQLLVVVVSEDYFMSKWPMIELNAFVQANKVLKSNKNVAILPLFYGLSVSDLKDEKRQQRWYKEWETLASANQEGRIKVKDWKYALHELMKFNGLSYDRGLKEIVAYHIEIVSHICKLVPLDIKWDDSHIRGNAHEVILEKRKEIGLSPRYIVQVVGIYGVGGIGKTTICKKLCNDLTREYEGRVCHVVFNMKCSNYEELLRKACIELVGKQVEVVHQLDEGRCRYILRENLSKQRTFLALDNVWDDDNSIKHAQLFLNMGFHKESLVVVTARSQRILERLGMDGIACVEMPNLNQVEATKLFLDSAANGKQFGSSDMIFIEKCVAKCHFRKGAGRGSEYHPLALEVLGRQLSGLEEMPSRWVEKLGEDSGENGVFDVLEIGFNLLKHHEQTLFMDVTFFVFFYCWNWYGHLDYEYIYFVGGSTYLFCTSLKIKTFKVGWIALFVKAFCKMQIFHLEGLACTICILNLQDEKRKGNLVYQLPFQIEDGCMQMMGISRNYKVYLPVVAGQNLHMYLSVTLTLTLPIRPQFCMELSGITSQMF